MKDTKHALIFGSGLVAGPAIQYLAQKGVRLTIATDDIERAEAQLQTGFAGTGESAAKQSRALHVDARDVTALPPLFDDADVAISLLPSTMHAPIARVAIEKRTDLVTASYVSPEMQSLDGAAKKAGVTLLNELGVDPGIDHMSAMEVIDRSRTEGYAIRAFRSYCGGLPSPAADDNPFRYKFSWSPLGVLLAARNGARFMEAGELVEWKAHQMRHHEVVASGHVLEAYPNRDSLGYQKTYGLEDVDTMLRGTLRFPGWLATMHGFRSLGLLDTDPLDGQTLAAWIEGLKATTDSGELADAIAARFGSAEMPARYQDRQAARSLASKLLWLGVDQDQHPIANAPANEVVASRMADKMGFAKHERDLLLMRHEFVMTRGGTRRTVAAELEVYGDPDGASAMAQTVGLPVAMGAELLFEAGLAGTKLPGVEIPTTDRYYVPILKRLAERGIVFTETVTEA